MASDNIQVGVRVRDLIQKELTGGLKSHWTVHDNSICCKEADVNGRKPSPYMFDRVFDERTLTVDVFEELCKPIVDSALDGFNGTIFAYGQSSSGKTFTMSGTKVQPGIIALAVGEMFSHINSIPDREFLIRVGYIEIYNEKVSDLLSLKDNHLKLQEDSDHNIQIAGLTENVVKDGDDVYEVLKKGNAKRHTSETKQNDRSSRSHCILRFVIESRLAGHEDDAVNVSNLYFVDLAGSEKANENYGERFREGCAINTSLFILGMVIRKLSGDANQQHVSFRDSKLTRILQNALGGNSKTAIICTITPAHVEESDSTLKFASRAKNIMNKAIVNEVMSDSAMLKRYRLKIKNLEEQIKEMNRTDRNLEKPELEMRLNVKELVTKQHVDMMSKLRAMIVTSGTGDVCQEPPKKRRRETWCPGQAKRELKGISEISPPKLMEFKDRNDFQSKTLENTVFEGNDSFQLLENIAPSSTNADTAPKEASPDMNETIQTDSTLKQLFQLQDEHEIVLEELSKKNEELNELQEFTSTEREFEAEHIKELKQDLKKVTEEKRAMVDNLTWLEGELLKAHEERNMLRKTVEATHTKLNAAEDGSGLTAKSKQLTVSEAKVSDLNTDLETQKAQYEFHIQQMKEKMEVYTLMLEEKGVDYNCIKARMGVTEIEESEKTTQVKSEDIEELKIKHEQEINDLRNEIDMHVLAVEKGKKEIIEAQACFEAELESQKVHFQKDVDEAKEEIEIYQQMLDEEKKNRRDQEEIVDSRNEANLSELKAELESQKQAYEEMIASLRSELEAHKKMYTTENENCMKVVENGEIEGKTVFEDINEMKNKYENQIAKYAEQFTELRESLDRQQELIAEKTNENQTLMNEYKAAVESKEAEIQELYQKYSCNEINETVSKECGTVSKECQTERHVNFDFDAEIKGQKDRYEAKINDLTEEMEAYRAVLEEKGAMHVGGNNQDKLKMYKEEISRLQSEIENYNEQCEGKDDECEMNSEDVDIEKLNKDQLEALKIECEKYKELYEFEKAKQGNPDLSYSLSESASMEGNQSLIHNEESNTITGDGVCLDLRSEMLRVEKEEAEAKHKNELHELQSKLAMYEEQYNLDHSEENIKTKDKEIAELRQKLITSEASLQTERNRIDKLLQATDERRPAIEVKQGNPDLSYSLSESAFMEGNQSSIHNEESNIITADGVGLDLRSEMLRVEKEEAEAKHKNELHELQSKLAMYEEQYNLDHSEENIKSKDKEIAELRQKIITSEALLQTERNRIDQILQAVDERRPEFENHESMKSMYEGKIKELNEDIKIYMGLLDEAKYQSNDEQKDSNECNAKFTEEIDRLKSELEKFSNLYEMEKDKNESRENTCEQNDIRDTSDNETLKTKIQSLEENHKKEIEFMKDEFAKFAEEHFQRAQEGEKDMEEIKDSYEKELEYLKIEIEELRQKPEKEDIEKCIDIKSEMLKENFVEETKRLKESHAEEIAHLQRALTSTDRKDTIDISINTSRTQDEDSTPDTDEVKQLKVDVENLQLCVEKKKETILQQGEKIESGSKQCEEYQKTIEEMNDFVSNLNTQLQQLYQDIGVLEAANDRLKQEKLDLINARERFSQLSDEHEGTIDELKDSVKELQDKVKQIEEDNTHLNNRREQLEQQIAVGKGKLAEKDEEIKKLISEIEEQKEHSDAELQDKVKQIQEENTHLNNRREQLEQQIAVEKEKLADKDEEIKKLISEIEEQKEHSDAELQDTVKQIQEENTHLNSRREQLEQQIAVGKGKLADKDEEIKKLISEIEEQREHSDSELQDKVKQIEEENTHLENIREQLEQQIAVEKGKMADKDEEMKKLISEIEEQREHSDSELQETVKQLEEENTHLNNRREQLEQHIAVGKGMLADKDEEIKKLISENEEQREHSEGELQEKVKDMKDYTDELEVKVNKYEESLQQANEKILDLEQTEAQFSEKVLSLESDVELHACKVEALSKVCAEYEEKIVNLESEIDPVKMKNVDLESTCSEQEKKIENLTEDLRKCDSLSTEIDMLKEQLKEECEKNSVMGTAKKEAACRLEQQLEESGEKLRAMEEKVKELEEQIESLKEDNLQLERNLHPTSIKYHSLPENLDWETKWEEFVREEKKKRLAVYATVRGLKREAQEAQKRQENAFEEAFEKALEVVYEKERNTDVYKHMENENTYLLNDRNSLRSDWDHEQEINQQLREKIAKLEENGNCSEKSKVDFMTEDHPCKYKLEAFSATERLQTSKMEHVKRIEQYKETVQQYEDRISRMKNQMRRLQSNMDNTFVGRPPQMSCLDMEPKPTPSVPEIESSFSGSSTSGGIVDHFKVIFIEAENKRLKQMLDEQKKKMSRIDDIERENSKVKQELQTLREKQQLDEKIEKENLQLEDELKKTIKGKSSVRDASLINSSYSRHPLGEMFLTASDTPSASLAVPPSPEKEPRYKVPDLNPTRREDEGLMKQFQDDIDGCKTA